MNNDYCCNKVTDILEDYLKPGHGKTQTNHPFFFFDLSVKHTSLVPNISDNIDCFYVCTKLCKPMMQSLDHHHTLHVLSLSKYLCVCHGQHSWLGCVLYEKAVCSLLTNCECL